MIKSMTMFYLAQVLIEFLADYDISGSCIHPVVNLSK